MSTLLVIIQASFAQAPRRSPRLSAALRLEGAYASRSGEAIRPPGERSWMGVFSDWVSRSGAQVALACRQRDRTDPAAAAREAGPAPARLGQRQHALGLADEHRQILVRPVHTNR